MKKLHTILFVLGLTCLAVLVWTTGVGRLWHQFSMLGWGLVPIIVAEGIAELCHAIAWRYCFNGPTRDLPFTRLFRIHISGYAVNFLTPTASLAGELTKVALLAGNQKGPEAIAAVLIGKLSFALSHLTFVLVGSLLLLPGLHLRPALMQALLVAGIGFAVGIVIFLYLQKRGKLGALVRWLVARKIFPKTLQRFAAPMDRVDLVLKKFHRYHTGDLAKSVCWHLVGYAVSIFMVWYFLLILGNFPGFTAAARICFLALWIDLVTFAVPLNLGVLEGGRIVAFRTFGFGALSGLTFGVATRVAQLFWAGVGLASYALLIARTEPREQLAVKPV